MYVVSAEMVRQWDAFTIVNEPVSSIDLMERAATKCAQWILQNEKATAYHIFCGRGNNGGDGLAIARHLLGAGQSVFVYVLENELTGSPDFEVNLQRLKVQQSFILTYLKEGSALPKTKSNEIVIDALVGTGLRQALEGTLARVVKHINALNSKIISIDLPSGLFPDSTSVGLCTIEASVTLTLQAYKRGLLVQENALAVGQVVVLDIGLSADFFTKDANLEIVLTESYIRTIYRKRSRFAHKGTHGHALLAGGSLGKIGAVVLATRACICTGAGLTTVAVPRCGLNILQAAIPEAMVLPDENDLEITQLPDDIKKFAAIGVGPGLGTSTNAQLFLKELLLHYKKPMVLDADALNCLSLNPDWLNQLSPSSILTPHPKEFDRLFGEHQNDFLRLEKAKNMAIRLNVVIVLKGHHTFIALPDGSSSFNSTGNAGMAKGGTGDVLTGMITALLAQGYTPVNAALLAVYLHGKAGDEAAKKRAIESMTPSDLIDSLADGFMSLQ